MSQSVNNYILENKNKINQTFRNKFHLMPTLGWMNDPNGFVYYKGEYHLFYQYYPYDSVWGPMHWGHAKSKDLIHWEDLPVALEPGEAYDADGCFSGSAIVVEDKLYLLYTGHYERSGERRETQCLAVSTDGIVFEKYEKNPVISEKQLQKYGDISDFRDPKVFYREGVFYTVVATKSETNLGRILLFESKDLFDWQFKSILLEGKKHQGMMWECPDLFELDNKDVLIMSPIEMERQGYAYYNINSTVVFVGKIDWSEGKFSVENYHEIDTGLDFYAPQTCQDDEGNRVMVAWMQMWHRTIWSHELSHGWSGSMTFPRELSIVENKLIQKPYKTFYDNLNTIFKDNDIRLTEENIYQNKSLDNFNYLKLQLKTDSAEKVYIELFGNKVYIKYDVNRNLLTLTRKNDKYHIIGEEAEELNSRTMKVFPKNDVLLIECIIDTSCIELFVNHSDTMTATYYDNNRLNQVDIHVTSGSLLLESIEISELKL